LEMRNSLWSVTAFVFVTLPSLVSAADPHGQSSSGGMPQLDFGNHWTIAQVVWMFVIFGLLYFVMSHYALPQVAETLAGRRVRIDGDLEAAQKAKQAADEALAQHQAATAKARAEAQAAIAEATKQAQAEATARAETLNARLSEQVAAAEARIVAGRDAAMGSLRTVATDTAEVLIDRLIGGSVERASIDQAVGAALTARGST
jgi:F-type H+-transporting ATPase subunit b